MITVLAVFHIIFTTTCPQITPRLLYYSLATLIFCDVSEAILVVMELLTMYIETADTPFKSSYSDTLKRAGEEKFTLTVDYTIVYIYYH